MARKKKLPAQKDLPENKDSRPTAGNVKESGFENTTWEQDTDHDAASTEAERTNTARTLPGSSAKNKR